ncbi:hypothetical protein BBOR36S_01561 [Brevibacillus borstelensis]
MLYSKFSTPSLAFAHMKQARLPFVHLSVVFLNEAAGFTLCYGLLICSHSFELLCHRASTLGFLHQLPVSYEVTWLLPRLDFHQLAINGLLGTLQIIKTVRRRSLLAIRLVHRPRTFKKLTQPGI